MPLDNILERKKRLLVKIYDFYPLNCIKKTICIVIYVDFAYDFSMSIFIKGTVQQFNFGFFEFFIST